MEVLISLFFWHQTDMGVITYTTGSRQDIKTGRNALLRFSVISLSHHGSVVRRKHGPAWISNSD